MAKPRQQVQNHRVPGRNPALQTARNTLKPKRTLNVQDGPVRALAVFGEDQRILVFPENAEGGILEHSSAAPHSNTQLAARCLAGSPAAATYVKRSSLAVADAVSDFALADFEVGT